MGNLIVKNDTNVDTIVEIDVIGYPNKKQTGLNIPPNGQSAPIPLQQGQYDIEVTIKDPNGKTTVVKKQVTVSAEGEFFCPIPLQPEEPKISKPMVMS